MRRKIYSQRIEVSVTPRQKEMLLQEAGTEKTVNQLIREIIENYLS